jgi:glycosyltransferase involved in cell wall biosynthesis
LAATAAEVASSSASERAPAVSVVIPCYQHAEFLAEAVESVIGQTFEDWEIVIVDDGSTDATTPTAEALIAAHRDRRIRLIGQANQGPATARNNGIASSSGRYILPLDADDVLLPEMLAKTVALLEHEPDVAIAYTDFRHFGAVSRDLHAGSWSLEALSWTNQLIGTALFRREVWSITGGYNPNMRWGYEDWDLWIGAAEHGFRGRRIPQVLVAYRIKPMSREVEAWRHRRGLRRQIARNHPRVFTPARRLRYSLRRAREATQYWARRAVGRGDRA